MSVNQTVSVPIGGGEDAYHDAFYRYQMPAVECSKKRNNKTVIHNMMQISRSLKRSPDEIIKYLGHSLSTSGTYVAKSNEYVVTGNHTRQVLQDKVQEYCQEFVVCGMCHNPETEYKIKRDQIFLDCRACGCRTLVDETLKLCKYILTQHKLSKQASRKNSMCKNETPGKNRTKDRDTGLMRRGGTDNDMKIGEKREKRKSAKQVDLSTPRVADYDEHFDNPYFSTKGNPLFVGQFNRIAKASNRGDRDALEHSVDKLQKFLSKHPAASTREIVNAVTKIQEAVSILFSHERLRIFLKAVHLSNDIVFEKEQIAVLLELTDPEDVSLEQFLVEVIAEVCAHCPHKFPIVLIQLYDADVLDERGILNWASSTSKRDRIVCDSIREELLVAVKPLTLWLQEDSSEEE